MFIDQNTPASARPVVVGDTLSFNAHPDRAEDLIQCAVKWQQNSEGRSEKYMVFKARNVTAGDIDPLVPVFVQKSYYDKAFGSETGMVNFQITEEWQYGQRNKSGDNRFVVLHDQANKPYQHRFVVTWPFELGNLIHGVACVFGQAFVADLLSNLATAYLGDFLRSYGLQAVQSGDVLLVPSELSSGKQKTIKWKENSSTRKAEYYSFTVANATQKGQNVVFFIQKEWWDSDSASDNHISKIATKNINGEYEFKVDSKSQYGQADETGKDRWVVYHDKGRKPYQHRFVKSMLPDGDESIDRIQGIANLLKINIGVEDIKGIVNIAEGIFGDFLHTF